LNNIQFLF